MRIHVNGNAYDVKNIGERVWLNNNEITIKLSDDEIIINAHTGGECLVTYLYVQSCISYDHTIS
jgi:hypothetical protein